MAVKNDFKVVRELLHDAMQTTEYQKEFLEESCNDIGFDFAKLEENANLVLDEVEDGNDEEAELLLSKLLEQKPLLTLYNDSLNATTEATDKLTEEDEETVKEIYLDAIRYGLSLKSIKGIEKEVDQQLIDHVNYLTSPEYDEKRLEMMKSWEKALETVKDDPVRTKKLQHNIRMVKERFTCAFMFTDILNPSTHDREVQNIVKNYFDDDRSTYILRKFRDKLRQSGINVDIYRHFFNMEEKYLEEKYHVFNNLFLFAVMRYISFSKPATESIEIRTLLNNVINLNYNKFVTEDARQLFLGSIRNFLDQFEDYREKFNEENILHPNHPVRLAKEEKRNNELKSNIYKELVGNGYVECITDEIKAMSLEELTNFINEKREERGKLEEEPELESEIKICESKIDDADSSDDEE